MAPARKNGAGSRESRRILHKITEKSIKTVRFPPLDTGWRRCAAKEAANRRFPTAADATSRAESRKRYRTPASPGFWTPIADNEPPFAAAGLASARRA